MTANYQQLQLQIILMHKQNHTFISVNKKKTTDNTFLPEASLESNGTWDNNKA